MEKPDSYFDKLNNHFDIARLITKFLDGKLTSDEEEQLKEWINENERHRRFWKKITDPDHLEKKLKHWRDKDRDYYHYWDKLKADFPDNLNPGRLFLRKCLRYAAILIPVLLIFGAGWYFLKQNKGNDMAVKVRPVPDSIHIFPKGKVAQLVMANGQVVNLTDSLKEIINGNEGAKVRNRQGSLRYLAGDSKKIVYNTLATPRGGEYQVVLADGTKVWLNAASALRYPTAFIGKKREVYLEGEAYFEVAENEQQPFVVNTKKSSIKVLGTKFNISAYAGDIEETTTLAEGAVKVTRQSELRRDRSSGVRLKPGFEAVITAQSDKVQINKANLKAALAWKNGLFIFNNESLAHIMKALSRWYDVTVEFEGVDTLLHFTGRIRKYEDISGILKKLEMTKKVEFEIEGREVKVTPWTNDQISNNQ